MKNILINQTVARCIGDREAFLLVQCNLKNTLTNVYHIMFDNESSFTTWSAKYFWGYIYFFWSLSILILPSHFKKKEFSENMWPAQGHKTKEDVTLVFYFKALLNDDEDAYCLIDKFINY